MSNDRGRGEVWEGEEGGGRKAGACSIQDAVRTIGRF